MPLYELVLRYDDREELRLTDRPPSVGDTLLIGYDEWNVVLEHEPRDALARAAFLCELAQAQRARAEKLRADDAERRERVARVAQRPKRLGRNSPS